MNTWTIIDSVFSFAFFALYVIGSFKILRKVGQKGFWAFIPFAREFHFAKAFDMMDEAIVFCFSSTLSDVFFFFQLVFGALYSENSMAYTILQVLSVVFGIISIVYSVRIYSEVCRAFERKKGWVVAFLFAEHITMFLWGVSKKYMPTALKIQNDENGNAAGESGIKVDVIDKGLSINIKARTAKSHFQTKTLLKDIHMNIEPGNMVLLLGGSGAGKTTFVNAVTGYEKADAEVFLNGVNVYTKFDKMKYEIGFVPQQDLIRYNDTVIRTLEDSALLRMPSTVSRKDRNTRINEVMELFGLSSVKNNIVGKQSGGQKKRISIASEFMSNPTLFILDEPDSGLDGILARELMENLHEISRQGKIVIVITHTPDRVIDLFDKVIVLGKDQNRTGRLVFYGAIDEAKEFFGKETMEDMVRMVNREDEGGEGKADELIEKYAEVCNGRK